MVASTAGLKAALTAYSLVETRDGTRAGGKAVQLVHYGAVQRVDSMVVATAVTRVDSTAVSTACRLVAHWAGQMAAETAGPMV